MKHTETLNVVSWWEDGCYHATFADSFTSDIAIDETRAGAIKRLLFFAAEQQIESVSKMHTQMEETVS